MKKHGPKDNVHRLAIAAIIIIIGLFLLKYIPMQIWGDAILFDASAHISLAMFVLYILWFFIDQNKTWRIPFFVFSAIVLAIISLQRIITFAHNDTGLLLGLILGAVAIGASQWDEVRKKIEF
jgi:heme O synthase-like polyprenyltransferase